MAYGIQRWAREYFNLSMQDNRALLKATAIQSLIAQQRSISEAQSGCLVRLMGNFDWRLSIDRKIVALCSRIPQPSCSIGFVYMEPDV
jgi:hypothetical protein